MRDDRLVGRAAADIENSRLWDGILGIPYRRGGVYERGGRGVS